jgi:hypothetical protein
MRGTKVGHRVESDLRVDIAHNCRAQLLKAIGQKETVYLGELHTRRAEEEIPLPKRLLHATKKPS